MSGTSLDGLDIAYCIFKKEASKWCFEIVEAKTYNYPKIWQDRLHRLHEISAEEMLALDFNYGVWTGEMANTFLASHHLEKPDLIGSHGHTVFHNPNQSYTLQIGKGAAIAKATGCKVISDFRTQDVVLGGQGAPLVPIGDLKLFAEWDACLNLGGFANVSFQEKNKRIAFDICPANIVLNPLVKQLGMEYDDKGILARRGVVIPELLSALNALEFYKKTAPKSLGVEWVKENVHPIVEKHSNAVQNTLRTLCEHIAIQVGLHTNGLAKVLVTGGGVWNDFLLERIRANSKAEICVPDHMLVDYKESLIFAFLAVLKENNEVNCLSSVTGASKDHSSGVVHQI